MNRKLIRLICYNGLRLFCIMNCNCLGNFNSVPYYNAIELLCD